MLVKTLLCALWLDVPDEEGMPTMQVLKQSESIRCGDTLEFKLAVTRTDLQLSGLGATKCHAIRVKIP
jgi:hypothetical protein